MSTNIIEPFWASHLVEFLVYIISLNPTSTTLLSIITPYYYYYYYYSILQLRNLTKGS